MTETYWNWHDDDPIEASATLGEKKLKLCAKHAEEVSR